MAGLTLEQLQKMGAKPKTGGVSLEQLQKPEIPEPNFGERVGSDISKRQQTFSEGFRDFESGKQTGLETGIQAVGQGAGLLFDVAGEALKSVIDKIPEAVKKPVKDLTNSVLETPLGQAGLKAISDGVDAYQEWKAGNPRTARDLESIVNIATLFPIGKIGGAVGKETLSVTGETAGKVATKIETGLARQGFEETLDIIKPILSKNEKQQALEAGRGVVQNRILPRRYEKITLVPTQREKEIANVVNGIVKKSNSPIDNIAAINAEISRVAESVKGGLEANNTIFNTNQIRSVLNKAKLDSRIVFGSDKTLQNSYSSVVDEMMRQINNQPKNLSGLLQARKNFDQIINLKFPNLLSNPLGDTARQNAVKDVRKAVNKFIADELPEGNAFKSELRKQNLMYDAIENISQKTASVVDSSAVKKVMQALRQNPLVAGVTGGIVTYGALMGMFSNPVVIGTIALGGTFKLGTAIITSKVLRESLVSVLRALEKAGKMVDASSIRTFLKELPEKAPIGLTIKDVSKGESKFIPKELQPLAEEARKYKSAEEFNNSFVYHGTTEGRARAIQNNGLKTGQAIGATGKGDSGKIFFSQSEDTGRSFATRKDSGGGYLLRVNKNIGVEPDMARVGRGAEQDFITKNGVAPKDIQILGKDGKWYPLQNYDFIDKTGTNPIPQLTDFYNQVTKGIRNK